MGEGAVVARPPDNSEDDRQSSDADALYQAFRTLIPSTDKPRLDKLPWARTLVTNLIARIVKLQASLAQSRAKEAQPAGEWKPIESAPKDGTEVLVCNTVSELVYFASFRLPLTGEPQCDSHYHKEWRDENGRWATPTHWMRIPAIPKNVGRRI